MGSFHPVYVDVVVCEYGAAYRCHSDGFVFKAHFVNQLGQKAVNHAVAAAGTVVGVAFVEKSRTRINQIFRFDYIVGIHGVLNFEVLFEGVDNFVGVGYDAAHAAEVVYGHVFAYGQTNIFNHLSGVEFYCQYAFDLFAQIFDFLGGEGPQGDGAQQTYFNALCTGCLLYTSDAADEQ